MFEIKHYHFYFYIQEKSVYTFNISALETLQFRSKTSELVLCISLIGTASNSNMSKS